MPDTEKCVLCDNPCSEGCVRYWWLNDGVQVEMGVICGKCESILDRHYTLQEPVEDLPALADVPGGQVGLGVKNESATGGGQAGTSTTATMTVAQLTERLQVLRPDALVFVSVTTAEGKEVISSIEGVGNDMFRLVYLEGKEDKE